MLKLPSSNLPENPQGAPIMFCGKPGTSFRQQFYKGHATCMTKIIVYSYIATATSNTQFLCSSLSSNKRPAPSFLDYFYKVSVANFLSFKADTCILYEISNGFHNDRSLLRICNKQNCSRNESGTQQNACRAARTLTTHHHVHIFIGIFSNCNFPRAWTFRDKLLIYHIFALWNYCYCFTYLYVVCMYVKVQVQWTCNSWPFMFYK